jgi:hypothetical protein
MNARRRRVGSDRGLNKDLLLSSTLSQLTTRVKSRWRVQRRGALALEG